MKTIEIDDEVYAFLRSRIEDFGDSPNTILRRLLDIREAGEHRPRPPGPRRDAHLTSTIDDKEDELNEPPAAEDLPPEEEGHHQDSPTEETPPSTPLTPVEEFLQSIAFPRHRPSLARFLAHLSWLHKRHPQDFSVVASVRGRRRLYFSETAEAIQRSGSSTKPQRIRDTSWFVATNTSTRLKQVILRKVMTRLHYDPDSIQQAIKSLA